MSTLNTKSVSEIHDQLAIEVFVKKAQEAEVSEFVKTVYSAARHLLGSMSLQEFAAYTSNFNANKTGTGEKSQIQWLKTNKFPTIEKLANRGKKAIWLTRLSNGQYTIIQGEKTSLSGIKSFDAMAILPNEVALFVLKAVDLGSLTDSTGGGHQGNVQDEVVRLVEHARQQNLFIGQKPVKIYIVIDGRSAAGIIKAGQKAANGSVNIVINESANL